MLPADQRDQPLPSIYLGVGTGIYTYTGLLGAMMEIPFTPRISGFAAAGLGGWGYKAGCGVQFYTSRDQFGSAFGIGYSNAFGLMNFETELELANGNTQEVVLDLYNAGTVNLTYNYNFKLGSRSKFVLGTGYAIAVTDSPYKLNSPTNIGLSSTSEQVMQMMQPGGLIVSLSFLFAVE